MIIKDASRSTIRIATILCLSVFTSWITAMVVIDVRQSQAEKAEYRQAEDLSHQLNTLLSSTLAHKELISRALAALLSVETDIDDATYSDIASRLAADNPHIINLAAMPDYVIEKVYPYAPNAGLIGIDLRNTTQFERARVVEETQQSVFDGPISLLQGRVGYLVRSPVFVGTGDERQFWGVATVVFDIERILETAQALEAYRSFQIAIRSGTDPQTSVPIYGDQSVFDGPIISTTVELPSLEWQIAIRRSGLIPQVQTLATWAWFLSVGFGAGILISFAYEQQRARRLAQNRLMSAVSALPGGFIYFDEDDRLQIYNDRYSEIDTSGLGDLVAGSKFEDILKSELARGLYEEAKGREAEWLDERMAAHREPSASLTQELSNGRWVRIVEQRGTEGGTVGFRFDVTELVQSQRRAELAELRLRDAIELLPAGFLLLDADRNIEMHNKAYLSMFNKLPDKPLVGMNIDDIVNELIDGAQFHLPPNVDGPSYWQGFADRILGFEDEFEFRLNDQRWVQTFNRRTADGGIVGIYVDVTALQSQQAQLERANKMLRGALRERNEAQRRFDDIAKINEYWIWEQDAEGAFTFVSPGFRETFPDARNPLGTTRLSYMSQAKTATDGRDWDWFNERIARREPIYGFVYRVTGLQDEHNWIRISGVPFYDDEGVFGGYRGVGSHVSEFYRAMTAAQAANVAKGEFLNLISHEFRTPLTVILGFNAFLRNSEKMPAGLKLAKEVEAAAQSAPALTTAIATYQNETAKLANKIESSGQHLLTLVNDILDLSKIEAGALKLCKANIDVKDMLASVVDQFSATAEAKGLELVAKVDHPTVFGDQTRIKQVLINLVGNALKFTRSGSVEIRVSHADGVTEFCVLDTGIGMPKETHENIFREFWQVDSSSNRHAGGTGLGLSIVKNLVSMHGGTVTVESEIGQGSAFKFTIPDPGRENEVAGAA